MAEIAPEPAPWAGTQLRGAPRRLVALLLVVEAAAVLLSITAVVGANATSATLWHFAALAALCIVFEEISLQVGKLRLLISTGPQPDMTSVWTFAGALVLPGAYAALLAVVMAFDVWLRRQKASGQYAYRKVYSAATIVIACLAAATAREAMTDSFSRPSALAGAVAIAVAALVYTTTNRLLIVFAARSADRRASVGILGTAADNALELSTLCLAVMTAIVLTHEPPLTVLVLLPMALLQRGALVKQLETAAAVDAKTGLLNAIAWQQAAIRELDRMAREHSSAGLLLVDLDHFKAVNDNYGHLVGDAALQAVGLRLKRELRQYDVVGRFGGEEFVALLPGVDTAQAAAAAERIRSAIASILPSEMGTGTDATLAASLGVAMYPLHGDDLGEVLRAADTALYLAKNAGRNRVTVADTHGGGERSAFIG
jgi:diguanylate cyclase (GGDEF)-like protein